MVFGHPTEPQHAETLNIVARTEQALTDILVRDANLSEAAASTLSRVILAIKFLAMAASANAHANSEEIIAGIRGQVTAILPNCTPTEAVRRGCCLAALIAFFFHACTAK